MSPNTQSQRKDLPPTVDETNSNSRSPPPSPSKSEVDPDADYQAVVRRATAVILSMKTASRSNFTIAKQTINPLTSPGLLQIKETSMILPHEGLLSLSRIGDLLQSLHSDFGTYRCQLDNSEAREKMQNMSLDEQINKAKDITQELGLRRDAFVAGGNEVLDQHKGKISKVFALIQETKKDIEEKLRLIHELEVNIQYRQGLLQALKDKAVPHFVEGMGSSSGSLGTAIQALVVLIEWAANVVMSGMTFHITFKQNQELEVLKICKSTLNDQLTLIQTTEQELERQKSAVDGARDMLKKLDSNMWLASLRAIELSLMSEKKNTLHITLEEIDNISTKQSLALRPIRRNQALLNMDIESGIHMKRDVELFCDVIPTVLDDLKLLRATRGLIKTDDQVEFETRICDLGRVIFRRLEEFKTLYYKGSEVADPNKQEVFLKRGTLNFARDTGSLIQAIEHILRKGISTRKSKKLSKKRDNGDRYYGHCNWEGRPMTTSTEGLGTLQRVELCVEYIHNLSISSCTGMFLRSTGKKESQVQRSIFEFNLSNASLSDFWDVMRDVVEPGAEYFNNVTIEQPKTRFGLPHLG